MVQRRTLLRRLQEVQLSPDDAWTALERVKTHTSSPAGRAQLAHLMRTTLDVTAQLQATPAVQTPPGSARRSSPRTLKRQRQVAKPPGGASGGRVRKGEMVQQPADTVTLSAEAGEALIARAYQSNLRVADASIVEQVIRT